MIQIPKNIKKAMDINRENGNTLLMDTIKLEMWNLRVAFEEFDGDPNTWIGYTQITGHLNFDDQLWENFQRKARYCADIKRVHHCRCLTVPLCLVTPSASY